MIPAELHVYFKHVRSAAQHTLTCGIIIVLFPYRAKDQLTIQRHLPYMA